MYTTPADVQFKFLFYYTVAIIPLCVHNKESKKKKPKAFTADGNPNFTLQFEYTNNNGK